MKIFFKMEDSKMYGVRTGKPVFFYIMEDIILKAIRFLIISLLFVIRIYRCSFKRNVFLWDRKPSDIIVRPPNSQIQ
ncbi:hypothetical protein D0469_09985 [Peribacillus saganii]|uniref:Uncharacterized protein n=1 Tax=Peribacillus saganii TaxID=2303992 RepID=A0A372LNL9_9BACI|nr:hypothetical protein D0469_09985 [Peribacillus saganii]